MVTLAPLSHIHSWGDATSILFHQRMADTIWKPFVPEAFTSDFSNQTQKWRL
ncbi:hypothetical protein BSFP_063730 [Burkholderia stabilis]|uniref:Uncharacterized protein n=1 Tax=Burkholderia stabilis TaxID=95485 RepID=A0A1Y1BU82_9BURK|nr:hypothetical protein BSFP_063730 [Burkholderia stabilis]